MEDRRRVNRETEQKEMGWYWYGRQEEGKQGDGAERDEMGTDMKDRRRVNRETERKERG